MKREGERKREREREREGEEEENGEGDYGERKKELPLQLFLIFEDHVDLVLAFFLVLREASQVVQSPRDRWK